MLRAARAFTPLCARSLSGASAPPFRILSPTAILGYGFPQSSLDAALERPVDLIAVDAGSIDPGPFYLATRSSFTSHEHVTRDLRLMVSGFARQRRAYPERRCKLIIGTAGGCGTDNQVEIAAATLRELLVAELGSPIPIARIYSELRHDHARSHADALGGRRLEPLGPMPDGCASSTDELFEQVRRFPHSIPFDCHSIPTQKARLTPNTPNRNRAPSRWARAAWRWRRWA